MEIDDEITARDIVELVRAGGADFTLTVQGFQVGPNNYVTRAVANTIAQHFDAVLAWLREERRAAAEKAPAKPVGANLGKPAVCPYCGYSVGVGPYCPTCAAQRKARERGQEPTK